VTIEVDLFDAIKGLVSNRAYPDFAPQATTRPFITYSQIGGESLSFVENTVPSKKNGRFQFNVWGDTRASCSSLILQIESALVTATAFQARPVSAPSSDYDHDMGLYGAMQDFTVFSTR